MTFVLEFSYVTNGVHTFAEKSVLPKQHRPLFFKIPFMLKRERVRKAMGKLSHLFIHSKTATLLPEFAVEDLILGRTAALAPEFAVEDLPLGRIL